MSKPLALVFYERLLPGSQLVNRLHDLHYRVLAADNPESLPATVKQETPLLLFVDLAARAGIGAAIEKIKADPATEHLPIIAFAPDNDPALIKSAQKTGGIFPVTDTGLLNHLEQIIEQALQF